MISIDRGVFFVKNDRIALELYDLGKKFIEFVYDGKNTVILTDENYEEYILENLISRLVKINSIGVYLNCKRNFFINLKNF